MKPTWTQGAAIALATGLHLAILVAVTTRLSGPDLGGAPVVNATLVPMASFDGLDGEEAETAQSAGDTGGQETSASPAEQRPEAQPVETPAAATQPAWTPRQLEAVDLGALSGVAAFTPPPGRSSGPAGATREAGTRGGGGGDTDRQAGATSGGGAMTQGAAASDDAEDRWAASVLAWIERHKRHPGGEVSGIVTVSMELDRQGRLRDARLIGTSGSSQLDRLALDQLQAMQPFPRPPAGTRWSRRDFDVRIDYRLR